VKELVKASKEEMVKIKGVGEKTAERLVKMFENRYTPE